MLSRRKKICIVATVPYALVMFMKPHITMLAEQYDVTLIVNGTEQAFSGMLNDNIRFVHVNFERKISLWRDLVSLIQLYKIFRREQFHVVHSLMPKTGLLAMLAAFSVGVPHRIHTFTGQVWSNKKGLGRWGLKILDKLIAKSATGLLTDGFPQRLFLIDQRIVNENKIVVLGKGSTRGVEAKRFKPNLPIRHQIRSQLKISENAIIYLFLGRLNLDKGIKDLAHAFALLAVDRPQINLLVVGPDEGGMDMMLQSILANCTGQFHRVGFTDKPEDYMACADIFCLPSYREGFPSSIIEAAAVGVPAVASNIYGLVDAVVDGKTGILHQPGNVEAIKHALITLTDNTGLRAKMSQQAMTRALTFFATHTLVDEMRRYYQNLIEPIIK